mmetsp:Transcript_45426/g.108422  ORF Transcript_45426/g.108422 Transcript_45426/m.108422 type:complete len:237 (+) Transcript_45426:72-782(+)
MGDDGGGSLFAMQILNLPDQPIYKKHIVAARQPIAAFGPAFCRSTQSCLHVNIDVPICLCGGGTYQSTTVDKQSGGLLFSTFSPTKGGAFRTLNSGGLSLASTANGSKGWLTKKIDIYKGKERVATVWKDTVTTVAIFFKVYITVGQGLTAASPETSVDNRLPALTMRPDFAGGAGGALWRYKDDRQAVIMEMTNVRGVDSFLPKKTCQLNIGGNLDVALAVMVYEATQILMASWA